MHSSFVFQGPFAEAVYRSSMLTALWDRECGTGHPRAFGGERASTQGHMHRKGEMTEHKNV